MRPRFSTLLGISLLALGCGGPVAPAEPVTTDPQELAAMTLGSCLPDTSCTGNPTVGSKQPWRHSFKSPLVLLSGSPQHRGIDLIAAADSATQVIRGELKYGTIDKSLEDEDVEIFACKAGAWQRLGTATTDDEGLFTMTLSGSARLPIGKRPLFVSVLGDRSSFRMLGVVTVTAGQSFVSDVDGTLTSSENAFPESLITGAAVAANDGAPEALTALQGQCYQPIYLTSRGRVFTEKTRTWLTSKGFPTGPLRLAPGLLTLPGDATAEYKAATLAEIQSSNVGVTAGFGNRASDAHAYQDAHAPNIYLKGPEFSSEIDPIIASGAATGVLSYRTMIPIFASYPKAP